MLRGASDQNEPDMVGNGPAFRLPLESMTYKMVGPVNTINGEPIFRAVATHINWQAIGADPGVIRENSARIKVRFRSHEGLPYEEPAAVVAYGHSLSETWEYLRNFKIIFTCSGSHKFLLDRGIVPTHHVDSDPRPHKVAMLGVPHREVTYLIASICHPTYFDLLELYEIPKVLLWHMLFLEPEIYALLPKGELLLTGGNTVGPRAVKIARLSGYTNLHLFGFDASAGYADFHPNAPKKLRSTEYDGKTYWTTHNWLEHARMLFEDLDRMPEVTTRFYGDGLIQAMARNYTRITRADLPMGVVKSCHQRPRYQELPR